MFVRYFGGVAQLARAFGSYPKGWGFNSLRRYFLTLNFQKIPSIVTIKSYAYVFHAN